MAEVHNGNSEMVPLHNINNGGTATADQEDDDDTQNQRLLAAVAGATPASPSPADMLRSQGFLVRATQPTPPDGGWGWVIVAGAFLCNFIVDGIMFSFGIMKPYFERDFPEAKEYEIAIMGSLIPGLYLSLSPFAGALLNKYWSRPLVFCGGILSMLGFLGAFLARSKFYWVLFFYGVVGGVGFSLIYSPSILTVTHYFSKKRATATAITVSGSTVGNMLDETYGTWYGVVLICAGILLNCSCIALLFRPLADVSIEQLIVTDECDDNAPPEEQSIIIQKIQEEKKRLRAISKGSLDNCVITRDNKLLRVDVSSQLSLARAGLITPSQAVSRRQSYLGVPGSTAAAAAPPSFVPNAPTAGGVTGFDDIIDGLQVSSGPAGANGSGRIEYVRTQSYINGSTVSVRNQRLSLQKMKLGSGVLYRQDAYYTGNVTGTEQYRQAQLLAAAGAGDDVDAIYNQSMLRINVDADVVSTQTGEEDYESSGCARVITTKAIRDAMLTIFDFKMLASPTVLLLCAAAFFGMLGFFTPFYFASEYASQSFNMDGKDATFIVTIIGASNLAGRLGSGFLSDQPWADSLIITNVAMMSSGVVNILLPIIATTLASLNALTPTAVMVLFYGYATLFGLAIGPFITLRNIICNDLLGIEKTTSSYCFLLLFMGLASFVAYPILIGIKNATSYEAVFYISGAMLALSGLIGVPCRRVANWEREREIRQHRQHLAAGDSSAEPGTVDGAGNGNGNVGGGKGGGGASEQHHRLLTPSNTPANEPMLSVGA